MNMRRALAHDIDTITHIRICEAHLAELRRNIEQVATTKTHEQRLEEMRRLMLD